MRDVRAATHVQLCACTERATRVIRRDGLTQSRERATRVEEVERFAAGVAADLVLGVVERTLPRQPTGGTRVLMRDVVHRIAHAAVEVNRIVRSGERRNQFAGA